MEPSNEDSIYIAGAVTIGYSQELFMRNPYLKFTIKLFLHNVFVKDVLTHIFDAVAQNSTFR